MDDRPAQFGDRERCNALALISLAMKEDLGEAGDITSSATIPSDAHGAAPGGAVLRRIGRPARGRACSGRVRFDQALGNVSH